MNAVATSYLRFLRFPGYVILLLELFGCLKKDANFLRHFNDLRRSIAGDDTANSEFVEIRDSDSKKGFCYFLKNGKIEAIRKSFVLWMIISIFSKISVDRLHRFITGKETVERTFVSDNIWNGDFVRLKIGVKRVICRVIDSNTKENNTLILVQKFKSLKDGTIQATNERDSWIDAKYYFEHLHVERDAVTNKMSLTKLQ